MTMFNVQITPKVVNQSYGSCVLQCRLMMLYTCVKFREHIMNGIRVMERRRVHGKIAIFNIYNVQRVVTPKVG